MNVIIGADEVGTGALAGPALVCAYKQPASWIGPDGLRDSKVLTPGSRAKLAEKLAKHEEGDPFSSHYIATVTSLRIDSIGLRAALDEAFYQAIMGVCTEELLTKHMVRIVVDGNYLMPKLRPLGAAAVVKADSLYPAVMAASVIAKHARDATMKSLAKMFPVYGFETHVGYPTPSHLAALKKHGPCEIHRKSFGPVREALS